jgi:aminoglycoside 3-N-acetyltransferase
LIGAQDIAGALRSLGVRDDDVVFVHSSLQRSARVEGRGSVEKIATILDGLAAGVGGGVLAMPTFTYSFTNGEAFDVAASPSTVGLLTEHFRLRPDAVRTTDPIFSCALTGPLDDAWRPRLLDVHDIDCFGPDSIFAWLLERDALLVFFDVSFEFATLIHHVEQELLHVPYRYLKRFSGDVIARGERHPVHADFFVRDLESDVVTTLTPLWEVLEAAGVTTSASIERGPVLRAVRASAVAEHAREQVARNPDFLLERGHREAHV